MIRVKLFTAYLIALMSLAPGFSQNLSEVYATMNQNHIQEDETMKTYFIERSIPEAGEPIQEQLKGI
jgi:hypothetical protein